jgi:hypothetical protein
MDEHDGFGDILQAILEEDSEWLLEHVASYLRDLETVFVREWCGLVAGQETILALGRKFVYVPDEGQDYRVFSSLRDAIRSSAGMVTSGTTEIWGTHLQIDELLPLLNLSMACEGQKLEIKDQGFVVDRKEEGGALFLREDYSAEG